jgi:hypothetical protein
MAHVFQLEDFDVPLRHLFPIRRECHQQRPEESRSGSKIGVISDLNLLWTDKGEGIERVLKQPPRSLFMGFSRLSPLVR